MEFEESLNQVAAKVRDLKEGIETEEATKNAFIMPFIGTVFAVRLSCQRVNSAKVRVSSSSAMVFTWSSAINAFTTAA